MNAGQDWIEVVPPMRAADARRAFQQWQTTHPAPTPLQDDDVRIDLMRTTSGDRVRYLIRQELWRSLSQQPPQ